MLWATRRILELYDRDEFAIMVVNGRNGYGKTTYANRVIAEIYGIGNETETSIAMRKKWRGDGIHGNWDIPMFRKHLGFHPQKVTKQWFSMRKRDYVYHWDDAGYWLNAYDFNDPFVKDVGKYIQTARTDWACLIFSCIDRDDVFKKLRDFKSCIIIDITKEGAYNDPNLPPSVRNTRTAKAWHYWKDRSGRIGNENDWTDMFNCHVPNKFYNWYQPLRRRYSRMAKQMMRKKAMEKHEFIESAKYADV